MLLPGVLSAARSWGLLEYVQKTHIYIYIECNAHGMETKTLGNWTIHGTQVRETCTRACEAHCKPSRHYKTIKHV